MNTLEVHTVTHLYVRARARGRVNSGPTRPGPGMTAVLLALTEDSFCGAELSRRTGYAQPSVSCWLRRLGAFGLAEVDFVIQGRAGGRAAEFWALTEAGRELAEALFAESSAVAS